MNIWIDLFGRYWRVSCFKESPANTPHSLMLLCFVTVFYYATILFQWLLIDLHPVPMLHHPVLMGFLLLISYFIYTGILLKLVHKSERFVQVLSCILAGHALVHVLALPLLLMTPWLTSPSLPMVVAFLFGIVYLVLTVILSVWQLTISAYVYKHALDTTYFQAALAALGLLATNILTVSLIG